MMKYILFTLLLVLSGINLSAQNCPQYPNTAQASGEACGNQAYTITIPNTGCNGQIFLTVTGSLDFFGDWSIVSDLTGAVIGSGSTWFGESVNQTIGPLNPNVVGTAFNLIVNSGSITVTQNGTTVGSNSGGNQHFSAYITISDATINITTPSGIVTNTTGQCKDFIVQVPLTNSDFCTKLDVDLPWEIICNVTNAVLASGIHSVTINPQAPSSEGDLVNITWNATTCSWDVSTNNDCDLLDIGSIFNISPDPSSLSYSCTDGNENFEIEYIGFPNSPDCCETAGPTTNITFNSTFVSGDAIPQGSPYGGVNNSAYINIPPNNSGGNGTSFDLCVDVTNYCRVPISGSTDNNSYYVIIFVDGAQVFMSPQLTGPNYSICIDLLDLPSGYNQSSEVEVYMLPNTFSVGGSIFTTYTPNKNCNNLTQGEWKADINVTIDTEFEEMIGTPVICTFPVSIAYTSCGSTTPPSISTTAPTCLADGFSTITNYNPTYTYDFTPAGPTVDANGVINGATLEQNYSVTAGVVGCISTPTTFTNEDQLEAPSYTVSTTNPTCETNNGEIVITPTLGTTITDFSIDNGATTQAGGTFSNLGEDTFTILVTGANGCEATESITLAAEAITNVDAGSDIVVCENENVTLVGSNAHTYSWDNGVSNNVAFTPSVGTTTYTVTGTDINGCTSTDQVSVTVNPEPTPSFVGNNLSACSPMKVEFTNTTNLGSGYTCTWNFGDGSTSTNCDDVAHIYNVGGLYSVSLTVNDQIGCVGTYTETEYVEVIPSPKASFIANPMVVPTTDPIVNFTNTSTDANNYTWDFGDKSDGSTESNPSHKYLEGMSGNYVVTLIASNGLEDCNDTTRLTIKIEEELTFYIPNSFTPDGDSYNDVFKPIFTSGFEFDTYTLSIYNRWGETLFVSHNLAVGWDGTYGESSGRMVQEGVYIWIIKIKEKGRDKYNEYSGHLTLIR